MWTSIWTRSTGPLPGGRARPPALPPPPCPGEARPGAAADGKISPPGGPIINIEPDHGDGTLKHTIEGVGLTDDEYVDIDPGKLNSIFFGEIEEFTFDLDEDQDGVMDMKVNINNFSLTFQDSGAILQAFRTKKPGSGKEVMLWLLKQGSEWQELDPKNYGGDYIKLRSDLEGPVEIAPAHVSVTYLDPDDPTKEITTDIIGQIMKINIDTK